MASNLVGPNELLRSSATSRFPRRIRLRQTRMFNNKSPRLRTQAFCVSVKILRFRAESRSLSEVLVSNVRDSLCWASGSVWRAAVQILPFHQPLGASRRFRGEPDASAFRLIYGKFFSAARLSSTQMGIELR